MPVNVIHDTNPSNQITSDHIRLHNHYEAVKITFTEDKVEFDVKAHFRRYSIAGDRGMIILKDWYLYDVPHLSRKWDRVGGI
jgi:hypothetical protein